MQMILSTSNRDSNTLFIYNDNIAQYKTGEYTYEGSSGNGKLRYWRRDSSKNEIRLTGFSLGIPTNVKISNHKELDFTKCTFIPLPNVNRSDEDIFIQSLYNIYAYIRDSRTTNRTYAISKYFKDSKPYLPVTDIYYSASTGKNDKQLLNPHEDEIIKGIHHPHLGFGTFPYDEKIDMYFCQLIAALHILGGDIGGTQCKIADFTNSTAVADPIAASSSHVAPSPVAPSPVAPSLVDPSPVAPSLVDPSLVDPSLVDPSLVAPVEALAPPVVNSIKAPELVGHHDVHDITKYGIEEEGVIIVLNDMIDATIVQRDDTTHTYTVSIVNNLWSEDQVRSFHTNSASDAKTRIFSKNKKYYEKLYTDEYLQNTATYNEQNRSGKTKKSSLAYLIREKIRDKKEEGTKYIKSLLIDLKTKILDISINNLYITELNKQFDTDIPKKIALNIFLDYMKNKNMAFLDSLDIYDLLIDQYRIFNSCITAFNMSVDKIKSTNTPENILKELQPLLQQFPIDDNLQRCTSAINKIHSYLIIFKGALPQIPSNNLHTLPRNEQNRFIYGNRVYTIIIEPFNKLRERLDNINKNYTQFKKEYLTSK